MRQRFIYIVTERSTDDGLDIVYPMSTLLNAIGSIMAQYERITLKLTAPDTLTFVNEHNVEVARILEIELQEG